MEKVPLSALVSRVLGRLTADAEARSAAGEPSLAVWSNVLRCLVDGPLDEKELPTVARLSKRLATAAITTVTNHGWVEAKPASGKNRVLHLTESGVAGTEAWRARLDEIDRPWVGTPLRAALETIVGGLPFELPHFPASYGAADPSAVGGPYMQNAKRKEGVPAHGTDWRPVRRSDGDTVSTLPITALLSQALMAFTIDYEDRFPWPLASTATVLVHIKTTPTPLSDLPPHHGITGKGKSLLERHLIVTVDGEGVTLTDRGRLVLEHHPARLVATEAIWRARHGADAVDALRAALTDIPASMTEQPEHVMWTGAE